ncbi:MAG: RnfABCDGE type electron transport complex subunit G [Candidatus Woesearchaeota archaeon]
MNSMLKSTIVLALVCIVSGAVLGLVYSQTYEIIKLREEMDFRENMRSISPLAEEFIEHEGYYQAIKDNEIIGVIMPITVSGYGGDISVAVGIGLDNKITGVRILSHGETPGLGANIVRSDFYKQFDGLERNQVNLVKNDGKIDAITGATITTDAVVMGVRRAFDEANISEMNATSINEVLKDNVNFIESMKSIFSSADEFVEVDGSYQAINGNNIIGIIRVVSVDGHRSEIKMIVGVDLDNKIAGVRILEHGETPGAGGRIANSDFYKQFDGLEKQDINLIADGGKIDAITGATITTDAVVMGVRRAFDEADLNDEIDIN